MPNWKLNDQDQNNTESLTGYAVYDAIGVRLGYVSGTVTDGDDRIQMLKLTVTEWTEPSEYLVPIGAITLIDDQKLTLQLRDLTKHSIGRMCIEFKGQLPERRLLVRLSRNFPAPRATVLERLSPSTSPSRDLLTWTRLSELASTA